MIAPSIPSHFSERPLPALGSSLKQGSHSPGKLLEFYVRPGIFIYSYMTMVAFLVINVPVRIGADVGEEESAI